jgi:hypothetical protein
MQTSKTNAIEKTPDGYTYLDPAAFPKAFAADLPAEQAEFEAHSQMLTAAGVFTTPVTDPAWKVKPSSALVADADKIIIPTWSGSTPRVPTATWSRSGARAIPSTNRIPKK